MVSLRPRISFGFVIFVMAAFVLGVGGYSSNGIAFVLLSAQEEATLDVSPYDPVVTFTLSGEHPDLKDKDDYANGIYSNLSDSELWPILVQNAMNRWNEIRGAYVELQINPAGEAKFDAEDRIHSIVVGSQGFTSAALANPQIEDGKIVDCDIKVGTKRVSANSLFYTLIHELGHCLGLGHNHTNYSSIMSYSRDARTTRLGADDIAGAIYLYPDPNVIDEDSSEAIGCGVLSGQPARQQNLWGWLLLLLPLPLLLLIGVKSGRARVR